MNNIRFFSNDSIPKYQTNIEKKHIHNMKHIKKRKRFESILIKNKDPSNNVKLAINTAGIHT